ncbi:MAG: AMP-binding protein [Bacteroidales bacterium]|nr:AMP-binding protein [Bacteroidales bacterium]
MEPYLSSLERTIKTYWDHKALANFGGEQFTYGELATNIEKFHIFFEKIGIQKGQKIAICASNSARWATTFLAINTYEAVVVPLLADFLPENAANLTTHSESVLLFTDKAMWEKIKPEQVPNIKAVINNADYTILYSTDPAIDAAFNSLSEEMAARYPMGYSRENVKFPVDNMKNLAVINYTSGTTSSPKGVMLSYENISASVDFAIRHIPAGIEDSIVSMLPMGHIYGMVFEFIYPLSWGVDVTYLGKAPAASTLLKAVGQVQPYLIITVPLVMEKIAKSSIKPVLDKWFMKVLTAIPGLNILLYSVIRKKLIATFGGKVQQFIMGGAALNPDVEKIFRKLRLPYTVGYGMTEAAPLLAYAEPPIYVKGSCGKKVDSAEVRIDSEDPANIAGEIQARGKNICLGYFNNPEASAGAFTEDGFLRTGDLGTMDANGNITIRGRSKNMILSANGQNIYPEEVEAVVNAQEYVAESVVVDRSGKLVALVYLDQDGIKKAGLDEETISDIPEKARVNANKRLPSYSQITKVEVVLVPFEKTPKMSIKRFMYK